MVADEVRNLASKSDHAAKQTKKLIESSMAAVERGDTLVEDVDANMQKTVECAGAAIEYMDKLAESTISEAEAIAQLTTGVDQISSVVQTNSATSEESAAASEELSSQAVMMKQMVQRFHLKSGAQLSFEPEHLDMTSGMSAEHAAGKTASASIDSKPRPAFRKGVVCKCQRRLNPPPFPTRIRGLSMPWTLEREVLSGFWAQERTAESAFWLWKSSSMPTAP